MEYNKEQLKQLDHRAFKIGYIGRDGLSKNVVFCLSVNVEKRNSEYIDESDLYPVMSNSFFSAEEDVLEYDRHKQDTLSRLIEPSNYINKILTNQATEVDYEFYRLGRIERMESHILSRANIEKENLLNSITKQIDEWIDLDNAIEVRNCDGLLGIERRNMPKSEISQARIDFYYLMIEKELKSKFNRL